MKIVGNIRFHIVACVLGLLVVGGTMYYLQPTWLLHAVSAYLGMLLSYHIGHLYFLERYLSGQNDMPSFGVWQTLLSHLQYRESLNKRQKQQLADTLKLFQAAAETLPIGMILLNKQQKIEWLNHSATHYLNLDPHTALGAAIQKQDSLIAHREFWQGEQQSCEIQVNIAHPSPLKRNLHLRRIPFQNQTELLIIEDISRAEQLEATRTAFVANVSHELRTPLTVIRGFLETINDNPNLAQQERQVFLGLMQQESDRMMDLVNDLLTLSTLEDPHHRQENREQINLSDLCQSVAQAGEILSAHQHQICTDIQENLWINAHAKDLYQALSNLVFNAIRYTPKGGVIHIQLHAIVNPNPFKPPLARFCVRDNGVGIAAEHLPHITKRFYRVDKGRSRANGGTGLGLAIAKHALANHDAELNIQSTLGQGSQFSADLPTIPAPID